MRLWIDANSARSVTALRALAKLAIVKGVELTIHPQVYLERRRQRRAQCAREGKVFREEIFDGFLRSEKIAVADFLFDRPTAATWADRLHQRYPTDEEWGRAKKATIGGELRADFKTLPGQLPMTTDWLIALLVEGDVSSRIITRDDGEEWRALRESVLARSTMAGPQAAPDLNALRVLTWDQAMSWLQGLPNVPAGSSAG